MKFLKVRPDNKHAQLKWATKTHPKLAEVIPYHQKDLKLCPLVFFDFPPRRLAIFTNHSTHGGHSNNDDLR